jgi:rhodanese-related sulfurtransferase
MPDIDAAELNSRINNSEKLMIIDVRDELEYHTFNIGGNNIPLGKLVSVLDDLGFSPEDEIIVVCKMGLRSNTAKHILQQNGYHNVKNLKGGLQAIQKLKYKQ